MIRLVRWKADYTILTAIDRNAPGAAADTCFEVAEALRNDIKSNWSVGTAPAIDKGFLDAGTTVDTQGRSALGRFAASDDVQSAFVRMDTGDSDRNRQYAQAVQEYSGYPFLVPAIERILLRFPQSMSVFFEKIRKL